MDMLNPFTSLDPPSIEEFVIIFAISQDDERNMNVDKCPSKERDSFEFKAQRKKIKKRKKYFK